MSLLLGSWLLVVVAATVGLAVGSFLNVVVYRVPAGRSVLSPSSACPGCATPIRGRDNVPVLSWLLLRGRCRTCAAPISVRYPLVEVATGTVFGAAAATVTSSVWLLGAVCVVAAASIALVLIDVDCGRLPFPITGVAGVGAVLLLVGGWVGTPDWSTEAVRVAAGAGVWLGVYATIWLVTSGRGMGLGDVALAPVLGGLLGAFSFSAAVVGLAAGFVLGAVVGVLLLVVAHRAGAGRGVRMPFGPAMVAGAVVGLVAGQQLASLYLAATGLA